MCLGSTQSYPDLGPRDTSEEIIKSKYELSDENKAKNLTRKKAKAKSLINFDGGSGEVGGTGTSIGNGLSSPTASSGHSMV